jgi:hypothetical protein
MPRFSLCSKSRTGLPAKLHKYAAWYMWQPNQPGKILLLLQLR